MAFSRRRQWEPTPPIKARAHALIVNHCHSLTSLDPLLLPHAIKCGMAAFVQFKWDLNPVLFATSAEDICVNNPCNCCPHRRPHHQHIFLDHHLMNNCAAQCLSAASKSCIYVSFGCLSMGDLDFPLTYIDQIDTSSIVILIFLGKAQIGA